MPSGARRVRSGTRDYEIAAGSGGGGSAESIRAARELILAMRHGDAGVRAAIEELVGHGHAGSGSPSGGSRSSARGHRERDALDKLAREFLFRARNGLVIVRGPPPPSVSGGVPISGADGSEEGTGPELTWYEVKVLDEVGQPVSGLSMSFTVGGTTSSVSTGGDGTARAPGPRGSATVTIPSVSAAYDLLESRWQSPRNGTPPTGSDVSNANLTDPFPSLPLTPEKTRTVVLQPPLTKILAEKLTFEGNHAMMKVNTSDWLNKGAAHPSPEWTRGGSETRPVSYTKGSTVKVKLELSAEPTRGPAESIHATGTPTLRGLSFEGDGQVRGSATPIEMSDGTLPDQVTALSGNIAWKAKLKRTDQELNAGSSSDHKIFVTLGTPIDLTSTREAGITEKRMEAAVKLVERARSNDPHDIVGHLMSLFRFYTLRPDPAVPAEFKHPTYFNNGPGAWPMADFIHKSGECQAIVRFTRAVIKQVGCPGDADLVVVWADPDHQNGEKALEAEVPPGGGLNGKRKMVSGKMWYACLVDTYPEEGKIYDIEELNNDYMGLNNFEACLRFTHGGVKRYYGGGAGHYDSPDEVILAFFALAWVSITTHPNGHRGAKVEKVVKRWRDASGNLL